MFVPKATNPVFDSLYYCHQNLHSERQASHKTMNVTCSQQIAVSVFYKT